MSQQSPIRRIAKAKPRRRFGAGVLPPTGAALLLHPSGVLFAALPEPFREGRGIGVSRYLLVAPPLATRTHGVRLLVTNGPASYPPLCF